MITAYFHWPRTIARMRDELFGPYLDEYAQHLGELGYCDERIKDFLRTAGRLGRWMQGGGLEVSDLDVATIDAFKLAAIENFRVSRGDSVAMSRLIDCLRMLDALPEQAEPVASQTDLMVAGFEEYLVEERGVSSQTLRTYVPYTRQKVPNVSSQAES